MSKEIIKEGQVEIEIDSAEIVTKDLEVFYNPDMILNRDISLATIQSYFDKPICIGLPLAGTGVRGVRIAKELPQNIKKLCFNDASNDATRRIKENLERNNIIVDNEKIQIHEKDACLFLEESQGYDYIDIDPFGSPNQFLDTAIRKLSRKGILAVTATDTACLAGTYPTTCKRKYWSTSCITPLKHEMGLRILARKVMLLGIHQNKVLVPLLSYHHKHYYRIIFRCIKSKEQCAKLLDKLNTYVNYDNESANYSISQLPDESKLWCGPLYNGSLQDKDFLEKLETRFTHKIIDQAISEVNIIGSFDLHQLAQKNGIGELIPMQWIIDTLLEKDFQASRDPYNVHAIKTTATHNDLLKIINSYEK
jgi:tRNA (guanine26-N2/guanine27-N2)-dimethyltransferase